MTSQEILISNSLSTEDYYDQFIDLLSQDLDFHSENSSYSSHNFHSFPAKFPPQIPRHFIEGMTNPGDLVVDPMQGSGTTVLESILTGRIGLGFDIDPLSVLISSVKLNPLNPFLLIQTSKKIIRNARENSQERSSSLIEIRENRWDSKSREFIDYWFDTDVQFELISLLSEIEKLEDCATRNFFRLAFSAIIITKSGGVSLALDLAHTRPHRAKLIYSKRGELLEGQEILDNPPRNIKFISKSLRSPIDEFKKRVDINLKGLLSLNKNYQLSKVIYGNARNLPLGKNSVDLIVTSPPYASNAIDYMRAHKFSLIWFGYSLDYLSSKRNEYIGGDSITGIDFMEMPEFTTSIIKHIHKLDNKKGLALHRYYSEMAVVLQEMYRVLKPGKAAIVVVGTSQMRNQDTQTQLCLADIGKSIGFVIPKIGVRNLDRNRRMLPAGQNIDLKSQIQQRMHEEYVIGFFKPIKST